MTSHYSNKTNTLLKSNSSATSPTSAAMRLNPSSAYQAQQQLPQQQPQHHQQQSAAAVAPPPPLLSQQRHHQQQLHHNNALQQQMASNATAPSPHLQGVFNNSNQQQNSWSTQQTGYLPSTKMMQPTPPPPAAANNWSQQQQQQQQPQQNFQNVNMYQQNPVTQPPLPPQQQWPQNTPQTAAPATYDNYYQQQQQAAVNNNMFQPQQQPGHQQVAQQNPATFFQQQPQASQNPPTNSVNFFDNTNNNNNQIPTGDGWGDWDWNDNTTISAEPTTQNKNDANSQNSIQTTLNQTPNNYNNTSIIADSFNSQNNNDSWNWGGTNDNEQQQQQSQQINKNLNKESLPFDNHKTTQNDNWNWTTNANDNEKLQQQQQHQQQQQQQQQLPPSSVPVSNEQHNDNWNWQSTNENQQHLSKTPQANLQATSPPPPPPTEFSSSSAVTTENHNYNTNASSISASGQASSSNIPNTVFVTQAKPVTLPSRQYASPPAGNTPVTENPPETALMPPQAFQNVEEPSARPQAVNSPALPPPTVASPPLNNLPPPTGLPVTNNTSGNPFKRSGVAQHHRATGLMATTNTNKPLTAPTPAVFSMPPPPPADFANPASVSLLEPDNNELPSQENQEVLSPPTSNITLPNASTQPSITAPTPASISLPNSMATQPQPQPPPPNDERNQYLQTSHLSENSEEHQQPEADGLLPPPGLSRLVLGEPELEASQQRMVMGTEAPQADNAVTQAAVMHLEERHADGEDTASDNAAPVISLAGQTAPPPSTAPTSDRNLYLVPGESNNPSSNNQTQQRVVTGVELAEQREIEMDGENLEDEQIQHQQQQQQQYQQHHQQQHPQQHHQHPSQHHHHHSQGQHTHTVLSPEARNEPPVEGADDNVAAAPVTILTPANPSHSNDHQQDHSHQQQQPQHHHQHHHSTNQLAKSKDTNTISSPNDDDDSDERLLNERVQSTAGSSKSRSKYENDRLTVAAARRRDKRSSAERYESDEYFNSEGEYSSEREERERRERERRRNYREGSVRSDRGGINDDEEKRSSRRQRSSNKRDKYYYEGEERSRGGRDDRERDRGLERSKAEKRRQRGYDNDSRYETEESTRFDSRKDPARRSIRRSDRSDQGNDYDDYNRRGYRSSKRAPDNYESDRRDRRRSDKHREPRYRDDPRYDPREYEDYRKHSSRNARESDLEKEAAGASSRSGRMHHDPRHAAMYGYPAGGYYDPYTAYYYQQMARTNPQAYAEWYKKYYGQAAVGAAGVAAGQGVGLPGVVGTTDSTLPATANDGRESVHSGRSSVHNDMKDRYTHAYITQANEYHQRHYQHQQQHLHQQHFHHHQQQQQQHQQQQQMAFNHSLNSTMLDDEILNHNSSLYSALTRSNTNLSQIHGGGYYMPTSAATVSSAAGVYYARSDYAESRSGAISVRDPDPVALEPQRLTPCKFITEHTVVSFASGILVTVKPKYTPHGSISNIVKLLKFKPNDETRKLFKVFPGPLVRGLTHKKTVIEFCHEQIRLGPMETTIYAKQLISNNAEKYRGSYTLMWNLLILLLKQNGMVVGTDIAELLLKNQQQFPYQTPISTANNSMKSKSGSASPVEELELAKDSEETAEPLNKIENTEAESSSLAVDKELNSAANDQDDAEENSLTKSSSNSNSLTEDEITEKFRNYLLYGNVNEALEWATDNNLWGHALFLASKLDRRSHANVMMKFANKLSLNDPLQTLYQLMSGRTPSSVTCVQDEKWGDWRPHLSMILSNTSQKPDLDRKAITTLGDSLFHRGDLYAAHFCYLMAQVGFGRYQESATQETSLQQHLPKLVLLGSSHYKQFQDFAHNEAIVMTEIYEYACSLNDEKFSIVEFQPYKFLLATRLLDYGFHLKSLMYLEQIAVHIARDPSKYESSFINKVYELADRLKYYDPVLEKTIDDQQLGSDDTSGLNLTPQQMEEQKWLQNLRQLAQQYKNDFHTLATLPPAGGAVLDAQQQTQDPNYYNQQQQQIDQQFMEINKQFSELNLQYQQQPTAGNNELSQQPMFYNPEQQQQQQTHLGEQQPILDAYQQQQQPTSQQSMTTELPTQNANDLGGEASLGEHMQQSYMTTQQPAPGFSTNYYDPSQYNAGDATGNSNVDAANSYDYWGQQQQQQTMGHMGEEPENEGVLLKQTSKATTILKASTNIKTNTSMAADLKTTPLALHTKKSPMKLKTNISSHNTSSNTTNNANGNTINKDKLNMLKDKLNTQPTKCSLTNTKSLDSKQIPPNPSVPALAAFNKLANNSEQLVSNNSALIADINTQAPPPFSINNNARPTISMPKSKTYDTDDEGMANKQQQQQQQQTGYEANKRQQQTSQQQQQQKGAKKEDKDGNKNQQQSNQNSGWFGGIWNKFSLKPKNQMILPDDKNPSIVWDPEKKKWVNTDGDEDEQETLKPPPKMSDLMPQAATQMPPQQQQPQPPTQQQSQTNQIPFMDPQQMQQQHQQPQFPNSIAQSAPSPNPMQQQNPTQPQQPVPAKTPTLQSNMFKMQRNRTLKNAYVDVFNPSGAPVNKAAENILAPALPPAAVPQGGFFIPGGPQTSSGADGSSQQEQYQQQQQQQLQQQNTPQFYNPNQFTSGTGY
ncbi:endoplasmic reticulum export factor secretory 16 isoform 2-T4 [Cochliomyia hominivorax]